MTRIAARLQRAGLDALITILVVMLERRMRKAVNARQ
jgi:hypothetical protein